MGFIFALGKFSRIMQYREKRENFPHAKISTFTVILCQNYMMFLLVLYPPSILRLNIAYFAVAEGWLLLDIG